MSTESSITDMRQRKQLTPQLRLQMQGALFSIYLIVEIALIFNLFHFSTIKEFLEVAIGVAGTVFAVLATRDASRAFHKAIDVELSLFSYRMNFRDVIDEMASMVRSARGQLSILIPTPAYGYLFGEQARAAKLVDEIERFAERPYTSLEIYLTLGSRSQPAKALLPQRYLRRAYALEKTANSNVSAEGYIQLVERVFKVVRENPLKTKLRVLNFDPNVRIVVADSDGAAEERACLLSFSQSVPDDVSKDFESKGFRSNRREMVQAVVDLIDVYSREQGSTRAVEDIRSYFVVLK